MKITFWLLVPPFVGAYLFAYMGNHGFDRHSCGVLAATCAFGLIAGFPLTALYWIVRLVRHAWTDKPAPAAPIEETGRVFGRLN